MSQPQTPQRSAIAAEMLRHLGPSFEDGWKWHNQPLDNDVFDCSGMIVRGLLPCRVGEAVSPVPQILDQSKFGREYIGNYRRLYQQQRHESLPQIEKPSLADRTCRSASNRSSDVNEHGQHSVKCGGAA